MFPYNQLSQQKLLLYFLIHKNSKLVQHKVASSTGQKVERLSKAN